jgi:hypothetical protein
LASIIKTKKYDYYLFGLIVTVFLLVSHLIKSTISGISSDDKGEIIAHILSIKFVGLAVFPAFAEYLNFIYGFMIADLPWLNEQLASLFCTLSDTMPKPFAIYYKSMNIAGTFLLALLLILVLCIILQIIGKFCANSSEIVVSLK